jgi:hypothetical protein
VLPSFSQSRDHPTLNHCHKLWHVLNRVTLHAVWISFVNLKWVNYWTSFLIHLNVYSLIQIEILAAYVSVCKARISNCCYSPWDCDRTISEMRGPFSSIQIGWCSMKWGCSKHTYEAFKTKISLTIKLLHFSLKITRLRSRRCFKR